MCIDCQAQIEYDEAALRAMQRQIRHESVEIHIDIDALFSAGSEAEDEVTRHLDNLRQYIANYLVLLKKSSKCVKHLQST